MVRVRDNPRAHPEQSERLNLQMRVFLRDLALVQRDVRVVLLVDVQVLHQPLAQKIVKRPMPILELVEVRLRHQHLPILHDEQRSAHAPAVRGDVHATVRRVHGDEFPDAPVDAACVNPERSDPGGGGRRGWNRSTARARTPGRESPVR